MTDTPLWAITLLAEVRAVARRLDAFEARLGTSPAAAVDDPVARLPAEAEALGIQIVLGGYVAEDGAARLLGRSRSCLKQRRTVGKSVACPKKLMGRWHYSLTELAEIQPEDLEENDL